MRVRLSGCGFTLRCALAALALVLASTAALPAIARADGDPASDYLLEQQVFLGSDSTHHLASAGRGLQETVRAANEKGFPIRVAVIASTYDLGAVTQLWGRPQTYARFLGIELSLAYKGRLLVVMPDGFGFYWHKHPTAGAYGALNAISIAPGGAGQLEAASEAVRRLAAKAGVSTTSSGASTTTSAGSSAGSRAVTAAGTSSSGPPLGLLIAGATLVLLAMLIMGLVRRRGPARAAAAADHAIVGGASSSTLDASGGELAADRARRTRTPWLWRATAAAVLVVIAAGVATVVLLHRPRQSSGVGRRGAAGEELAATPFTWKPRRRAAPDFHLRDQNGRPVSLSQYRGKPVIVTFIDPTCRNLCPLEAHVLNELDRRLPPAARPTILAVSVNVYSNSRTDLMQDFSRWHLVPQWHWAVGSPAALKAVWRRYYAEVEVKTKKVAGTTVHYISHAEMSYLIDGKGYERALFSWPFKAADVERALHELGAA